MNEQVVLLIDDEKNVINSLKRLLRREPYKLVAATRPEKAFSILDRLKVSLVITNHRMEGINGDEIISRVQQKSPGVKCIILTGYTGDPKHSSRAWKVMSKPWNDTEIKETIREALEINTKTNALGITTNSEDI